MGQRKIIHVDMDCFYAAVEEKHDPSLRGKPVGIGGPPQSRSVLCTANYEARKYGVRAAMPSSQAVRKCPHLILIPPNFKLYTEYSQQVRKILLDYTSLVEPLSLDEAFLDVTGSDRCQGSATLMATEIRQRIFESTQLTASAGIAPNKFLAKVASDWKKPNGQFVITPDRIPAFMQDLPVEKIFGVGKVTAEKMHSLGLRTCGDLQKWDLFKLKQHFGSWFMTLHKNARGICDREVIADSERKSFSVEETFNRDLSDWAELQNELSLVYKSWHERFSKSDHVSRIRSYQIKIKYLDFQQVTRQHTSTALPSEQDFEKLLKNAWDPTRPIRLLGVGVALGDSETSQMDLLSAGNKHGESAVS
jgi:DNA polymerase-4